MTLEEEIFKKSELDNNKLLEYGFIKKDNYLEYKKPILNNNFEIIVKVKENKIKGKIIDKESTMVMTALRQFMNGEETAFTPGEQQWDYLYSKDAGKAFYLIGEKGKNGSVYCVGSGQSRRLKEYILKIRDIAAPSAEPGIGKKPYPVQPVMRLCADISNLTDDTGFVPEYEFSEGISEMVHYLKGQDGYETE